MALLEIDRIKKDIQWLYYNMRCLLNKSALESPITATEWSSNHSSSTYNQYQIGTFVWYQGNIYECIAVNDGLPVTAALYWKLIGPGHLLQEEQTDWDATGGRSALRNKPTSTSEFVNDGEDGSSPFATLNDLPMLQDLDSVLSAGDTAEDKDANIKELGLYDDYQSNVVTPGFAKVFTENFKLWFKDKTGINLFYIGYGVVRFFKGIYTFNISTPSLTGNRTATFQDASGVVAYLSNIPSIPSIPSTLSYGLFAQTGDGGPVTATTVETTIIGPGVGTLTVPANGFQIGDSFTCALDGIISCVSSGEIQVRIKTLSGALLADTGIIDLAAATNKSWILTLYFTVRALGTTGTASISSGGLFSYIRNGGTQFEGYVLSVVNNTTFDTTIDNTLVVTVQWNTTNAGNSILSRNFTLTKIY